MHLSLLFSLALILAACTAGPAGSPSSGAPTTSPAASASEETERVNAPDAAVRAGSGPQPVLSTIRSGDGALGTITFRSESGVSISDSASLRLRLSDEVVDAPLQNGPARFTENDSIIVDQATYLLSKEVYFTLVATPAADVSVEVHDGTGYASYAYRSGDLID